jgi:hypothetical protein
LYHGCGQTERKLADEERASTTNLELRKDLGNRYGGGWLNRTGDTLTVGVTDAAAAGQRDPAGVQPVAGHQRRRPQAL